VGSIYLNTPDKFQFYGDDGSGLWNASIPITFAAGNVIDLMLTAAVTQFSQGSNVISSTQANFVSGAFRASRNGTNQTGVNPNDSFVKINFNSVSGSGDYVRGGFSYDTANSRFIAHKNMTVNATARLNFSGTNSLVVNYLAFIYVNGSIALAGNSSVPPTAGSIFSLSVSGILRLNVGDIVEVFMYGAGNNSSNTLTMVGNSTSYFSIAEIPDLSVVGISGAPLEVLSTESNYVAPAAQNIWMANHTGNSLTLPPGVWRLRATCLLNEVAASGMSSFTAIGIYGANGTGTGTEPALLQSLPGVQLLVDEGANGRFTTLNSSNLVLTRFSSPDLIVQASQTFTAYAVAYAPQVITTPANARVSVTLRAERIR
jgi:hypothetical protein